MGAFFNLKSKKPEVLPVHRPKEAEDADVQSLYDSVPLSRSGSPTPSEEAILEHGFWDWSALARPTLKHFVIYTLLLLVVVAVILLGVLHSKYIKALEPVTTSIRRLPAGFLIPIAILFVMSFPPLFGHEIIAIMVGAVWGAGWGFLIVSAGQFFGELANYFVFKYACRARTTKIRETNVRYACLAQVLKEGGLWIAIIARFSIIPTHSLFATCGMSLPTFIISALVSMPKQLATVYIGAAFVATGVQEQQSTYISAIVLMLTLTVTILAGWHINRRINAVKKGVVISRQKLRRYGKEGYAFAPTTYTAGPAAGSARGHYMLARELRKSDSAPRPEAVPSTTPRPNSEAAHSAEVARMLSVRSVDSASIYSQD
ncbi:hypothetical protein FIBSPDRAFT_22733 [Athelia psychrophila]|uniref:Golgi apparatus membrane protein TVP38 n=1 Tax=Athelia psychrophila TaxID=1759441 RepID=A0A166GB22_9AGAM|nr:hypothetical protein FIBSPDRAFT_22733 [Fibularhizoctonia sp. CBS 109695]